MTDKTKTKTPRVTKKSQILAMFDAGERDVQKIANQVDTTPSYVANVLQAKDAQTLPSYFDLYTSTSKVMNVYGDHFRGKMQFKDERAARRSVKVLEDAYTRFAQDRDRAGQHHTLGLALMMSHRALFSHKPKEAAIYRNWLLRTLARLDATGQTKVLFIKKGENSDQERLAEHVAG